MVKVSISAKIEDTLKGKLEEEAKKKGLTLSQLIADKLENTVEKEESSRDEFSLIREELKEKNRQIAELQRQVSNDQEIRLYQEKQALLRLESTEEKKIAENEELEPAQQEKRGWRFWKR